MLNMLKFVGSRIKNICKQDGVVTVIGKLLLLWSIGGVIYYSIECIWRGYSHWSMIIVGGLCFILIGLINEIFDKSIYIEQEILVGWMIIIILEFVSGCILNLWLGLGVWDYSDQPFNVLGQICLLFALLWIPLTVIAIFFDDIIRTYIFNEPKQKYRSYILSKLER